MTISADDQGMTYGGTLPALTATYTGLVNGDTPASLTALPTLGTVPAASHAGAYPITADGAVDADYAISYVSGTLTIGQAALTITADDQGMTYGGTLPALTATYTGLVNGDTPASLATLPTLSTVSATSHAGAYPDHRRGRGRCGLRHQLRLRHPHHRPSGLDDQRTTTRA